MKILGREVSLSVGLRVALVQMDSSQVSIVSTCHDLEKDSMMVNLDLFRFRFILFSCVLSLILKVWFPSLW